MFVDTVNVHLRAGNGGAGVAAFVRAKGKPRGKPIGGSGGNGGSVTIEANESMATLLTYKRQPNHKAGNGAHGRGDLQHGRHGEDLVLRVPPGTVVRDEDGTVLADLVKPGQVVEVLSGGRGGGGNASFVSPRRKAPAFAEQGEYGESGWFTLELKLMADAALIGFPNAGKSTLISRVSAAKPKIADYPFTTLEPHLGVVSIGGRELILADIPGLIEGAAEGRGLGHEFLRHAERARALIVLLDPSPLQERSPAEQYRILMAELTSHLPELAERPRVVAMNKADLLGSDGADEDLLEAVGADQLFLCSAVTGDGVDPLLHATADAVALAVRAEPERAGFILHRPTSEGFEVRRTLAGWEVVGRAAERAVRLDDLTVPQTADFVAARLERLGVDAALRSAGAEQGDEVRIGELVFQYWSEEEEHEEDSIS